MIDKKTLLLCLIKITVYEKLYVTHKITIIKFK